MLKICFVSMACVNFLESVFWSDKISDNRPGFIGARQPYVFIHTRSNQHVPFSALRNSVVIRVNHTIINVVSALGQKPDEGVELAFLGKAFDSRNVLNDDVSWVIILNEFLKIGEEVCIFLGFSTIGVYHTPMLARTTADKNKIAVVHSNADSGQNIHVYSGNVGKNKLSVMVIFYISFFTMIIMIQTCEYRDACLFHAAGHSTSATKKVNCF